MERLLLRSKCSILHDIFKQILAIYNLYFILTDILNFCLITEKSIIWFLIYLWMKGLNRTESQY